MQRKYGLVSGAQLRGFVDYLPSFQKLAQEMHDAMQDLPKEKWDKLLTEGYSWSWVYEFPFVFHTAVAVYAFNLIDWLTEVAASEDPAQRVLDDLPNGPPSDDFHHDVDDQEGIGLVISMVRTVQSVLLHGRSLSALLSDVRERDDLDSLFKAIKIDRTIVTSPTVADRIAKAEFQNDKVFFRRLSNAFKGPSQKEWAGLSGMKFSMHVLMDSGLKDLSDDELEELMVHVLEVYKDVPGARKNIRMHYQNFRKFPTI